MARAQIIVEVDQPAQVADCDAWHAANESRLTFVADNSGCGCCVDIYEVEGPVEVLRTIPSAILTSIVEDSESGRPRAS